MTKKAREEIVISQALAILDKRMRKSPVFENTDNIRYYLRLKLDGQQRELFGALFLTSALKLIKDEVLFYGSLNHTQIVPREVVRAALKHNAGVVILYHNHPGGDRKPSSDDTFVTQSLKRALGVIDVRIIDHIIVADGCKDIYSFAAEGLM
jgi:DNA repair protein RadC